MLAVNNMKYRTITLSCMYLKFKSTFWLTGSIFLFKGDSKSTSEFLDISEPSELCRAFFEGLIVPHESLEPTAYAHSEQIPLVVTASLERQPL